MIWSAGQHSHIHKTHHSIDCSCAHSHMHTSTHRFYRQKTKPTLDNYNWCASVVARSRQQSPHGFGVSLWFVLTHHHFHNSQQQQQNCPLSIGYVTGYKTHIHIRAHNIRECCVAVANKNIRAIKIFEIDLILQKWKEKNCCSSSLIVAVDYIIEIVV